MAPDTEASCEYPISSRRQKQPLLKIHNLATRSGGMANKGRHQINPAILTPPEGLMVGRASSHENLCHTYHDA